MLLVVFHLLWKVGELLQKYSEIEEEKCRMEFELARLKKDNQAESQHSTDATALGKGDLEIELTKKVPIHISFGNASHIVVRMQQIVIGDLAHMERSCKCSQQLKSLHRLA